MSKKIQKMTSNVAITKKNEKLYQTTVVPGIQETFSDKITPDIDGLPMNQ